MRLADIDSKTEATFLRCLHDEEPDDPRVISIRRLWVEEHLGKGLKAKVLILDGGEVAGLCQYMPIERSHFDGRGLAVVLCIWVHGYDHDIGNKQGNGYGRYMLEAVEAEAREAGFDGMAAWGMDYPYWNPVSFFEHMGYERVDKRGETVLVWKAFSEGAEPPAFMEPVRALPSGGKKIPVTVFVNGCCTGSCSQCVVAREAVAGLDDIVDYREYDTSDPNVLTEWGISMGVFVDGRPHRPDEPPCTSEVMRTDLLELAREREESE